MLRFSKSSTQASFLASDSGRAVRTASARTPASGSGSRASSDSTVVLVVLTECRATRRHPPGQVDVGPRRLVEPGEVLGRGRRGGEGAQRRGLVVGVVGECGRHFGEPFELGRRSGPPALHRWAISRATLRNGSTTAGLFSRREHVEHAVEELVGGQLAVGQHLEAGDHGLRPVDRLRQVGGAVEQHAHRGRVRADGGEGEVGGVEQVEVGVGEVDGRRGAGGLDRTWCRPARARRRRRRTTPTSSRCGRGSPSSGDVAVMAPSVQPRGCRCRPGRARRRSSRRGRARRPRRSPTSGRRARCCPRRARGSSRAGPRRSASSPTKAISCLRTLAPLV